MDEESVATDGSQGSKKRKITENSIERRLRGPTIKTYPPGPKTNKDIHFSHPLVLEMPELAQEYPPPKHLLKVESSATNKEAWKLRRGKFALATPESEPDYMWLPFFRSLKADPTRPEFVYLQPPKNPKSPKYDPYELEIVRYCNLEGPYFYTMSCKGVTLFRDGKAEFEALDQWERGYNTFRCIMYLDIFRQYKKWRTWAIWKHYVRRKKKGASTITIKKYLFIANVIFSVVLMQIREVVVKFWHMRFYHIDVGTIYTLNDFLEVQSRKKDNIEYQMTELTTTITEAIKDACIKAIQQLEGSLMGKEKKKSIKAADGETVDPNAADSGGTSIKVKPKSDEDYEKEERYTYLIAAAKRSEQARLLNFVRLADYIVTDGLRMVLTFTLEELLYEIRNVNPSQSKPMLETDPNEEEESEEPPPEQQQEVEPMEETIEEPIVDIIPTIQYFIVELHIRDEILIFDPSYQTYADKMELYVVDILNVVRFMRRTLYHPHLTE